MSEARTVTPEEANRLRDEATGGPWRWRNTAEVYLQGARSRVAMAVRRAGLQGAQPLFRDSDGILQDTAKANLYDFPDARLIAAAPDLAHTVATEPDRIKAARVESYNQGFVEGYEKSAEGEADRTRAAVVKAMNDYADAMEQNPFGGGAFTWRDFAADAREWAQAIAEGAPL